MSSGKFLILTMNCFFLFAFLTVVYFVNTISTGHRRSPRIKGKTPESGRDEMEGLEEAGQPEFEGEEEEGLESNSGNSGDSSYEEEESMDEVAQRPSTPVAAQLLTEYDTPIVTIIGGKTGKKKKTKDSLNSNDSNETIIKNSGKFVLIN
jgi:hypothetical protein